jgi:hypothetical protein
MLRKAHPLGGAAKVVVSCLIEMTLEGPSTNSRKDRPMSTKNERRVNYHFMIVLALSVGVFCIVFQFMPGWELLSFMLSVAVLGGLIGGNNGYDDQDRQQLGRTYKTAYEWLLLILLAAYPSSSFRDGCTLMKQ